jgi:CBS domain-containing protein
MQTQPKNAPAPLRPLETRRRHAKLTAGDLMSPIAHTIQLDQTVDHLASLLTQHHISGVPVVNRSGQIVGVVSEHDLALARTREYPSRGTFRVDTPDGHDPHGNGHRCQVSRDGNRILLHRGLDPSACNPALVQDIYHPGVLWVDTDTPIRDVARQMLGSHIHRLLVMDDGHLRGIITSLDLVRALL